MQQHQNQDAITRCQELINAPQYCALYPRKGKEQRIARMSGDKSHGGLKIMLTKYSERNAISFEWIDAFRPYLARRGEKRAHHSRVVAFANRGSDGGASCENITT